MRHRYPPPWRGVTLYYRLDRAARAQQYKWRSKSWGLKIADLTPHSGPPAYSSTRVYIPITMFECVHHGMPSCCVHTMVRSWSVDPLGTLTPVHCTGVKVPRGSTDQLRTMVIGMHAPHTDLLAYYFKIPWYVQLDHTAIYYVLNSVY